MGFFAQVTRVVTSGEDNGWRTRMGSLAGQTGSTTGRRRKKAGSMAGSVVTHVVPSGRVTWNFQKLIRPAIHTPIVSRMGWSESSQNCG